ncbi:8022_t:CDS:2, partial [Racocetra persica]
MEQLEMESNKKFPQRGERRETSFESSHPKRVVSNDIQNEFDEQIIVSPLSTEDLDQVEEFEVYIAKTAENGLEQNSKILGNRLQTIDKMIRLKIEKDFIGSASPEIMRQAEQ